MGIGNSKAGAKDIVLEGRFFGLITMREHAMSFDREVEALLEYYEHSCKCKGGFCSYRSHLCSNEILKEEVARCEFGATRDEILHTELKIVTFLGENGMLRNKPEGYGETLELLKRMLRLRFQKKILLKGELLPGFGASIPVCYDGECCYDLDVSHPITGEKLSLNRNISFYFASQVNQDLYPLIEKYNGKHVRDITFPEILDFMVLFSTHEVDKQQQLKDAKELLENEKRASAKEIYRSRFKNFRELTGI